MVFASVSHPCLFDNTWSTSHTTRIPTADHRNNTYAQDEFICSPSHIVYTVTLYHERTTLSSWPLLKPCSTTLLLNSWATSLSYSTPPFFIWTVKDSSEGITQDLGLWLGSWSCDIIWMWTESVLGPYPVPSRSPDLTKEVRLSLDSQSGANGRSYVLLKVLFKGLFSTKAFH